MNWLKRILADSVVNASASITLGGFPVAWGEERVGISDFLAGFALTSDGRLPAEAAVLPDEEILLSRSTSDLHWAPGAQDGVLSHHYGAADADKIADQALHLLRLAIDKRTPERVKDFYDLLIAQEVLQLADPLLNRIRASSKIDAEGLQLFARWLAKYSPDRQAVKMGVALLGLIRPAEDTELLMRLGLHDEFTLYAAIAIANSLANEGATDKLWMLAQSVDGWGRVHIVERLADTDRADVKHWLLRDGYKNDVMNEYLAYVCAQGGGLLDALSCDDVDIPLLDGAGELIGALLNESGPAQDIGDYQDGVQVIAKFLEHSVQRDSPPLSVFLAVAQIANFVTLDSRDWSVLEALGWTPASRQSIGDQATRIMSNAHWYALVQQGLESSVRENFYTASLAAEEMGLDIWEVRFERQGKQLGEEWFFLMQTDDTARVDRVIDLAEQQLDLQFIASGSAEEMGLGQDFHQHRELDFVLQELHRFPGRGAALIEAALQSPVTRNRHWVLNILDAWGRADWPPDMPRRLGFALAMEPVAEFRQKIEQLLRSSS